MRHRIRQFFTAGRSPTPAEIAFAEGWLPPTLLELFLAQHPRDICHGVATAKWLLARGVDDEDVIVAALLHDVGKGDQRRIDRVAYVVASWLRVTQWLGHERSRCALRRAVYRASRHAERGASMLQAHGASTRAVELTRRHHEHPRGDAMLALLQQADAES